MKKLTNQSEKFDELWQKQALVCSWVFAGAKMTHKHVQWYEQQTREQCTDYLRAQRAACESRGIQIIVKGSQQYPKCWQHNEQAPAVIYAQGDVNLLQRDHQRLSVVGSRQPNPYSVAVTTQLCQAAVANDKILVSGLAQGIDSLAHQVACIQGGQTIAVLGFGHDFAYPNTNYHLELKTRLQREQLVISQYPPQTPIARWRFIERNFLIATLSPALVVIQAGQKSGSLITAEMALEAGSDVYIVPGIYNDETYAGGQGLIEQGAIPLQFFSQILATYVKF